MTALAAFQARAQVARAGRKKFPYGPELRRLAVEHAREVAGRGGSLRSAADALGININCGFRGIAITDSGASRSPVPFHRDHRFRTIAIALTG
jgi:hypothetical protein